MTGTDRMPRLLVALLALTCGAAVANIYYVQPLLNVVADGLNVPEAVAGLLVTCSQVGYLTGLALLVPLGDLVERRRLIATLLVAAALALAVCAAAPTFPVLAGALVATGVLSVVAQIAVPLASALAGPHERGRVVGTVMSGLLIGILVARTVSGLVAALGGWRLVFALAAAAMLVLAVVLDRALPHTPPTSDLRYPAALRSVLGLVRDEPVLRQRMALAALSMFGFSVLWTTIAFLLGGAPYGYGEGVIGLFGLAGLAGALAAPLAGRWSDRGGGGRVVTVALLAVLVSWGLLDAGGSSLAALIAGIVLLDFGLQAAQISHQTAIYRLRPEARSRLTTAYMVSSFLGGVLGSSIGSLVYAAAGWSAACALGAAAAATALGVWAVTQRLGVSPSRAAPPRPAPARSGR